MKHSSVQRHCVSTKVVKMSCRKRSDRREMRDCSTLQSPFFKTARRRNFRVGPARYRLLKYKYTILHLKK